MKSMVLLSSCRGKQSRVAFSKTQLTPQSGHSLVMSTLSHRTPLFRYRSSLFFWLINVQLKSEPMSSLQPHLFKESTMALFPLPSSKTRPLESTNSMKRSLSSCGCTYQSQISCCSNSQRASQQLSTSQSGKFSGNPCSIRNCLYLLSLANSTFCYISLI